MNHDDRVGMRLPFRNLELDKRLSNHRHVAVALDVFAADIEVSLFGNGEDPVGRARDGGSEARTE
jgi:hypothetical protein